MEKGHFTILYASNNTTITYYEQKYKNTIRKQHVYAHTEEELFNCLSSIEQKRTTTIHLFLCESLNASTRILNEIALFKKLKLFIEPIDILRKSRNIIGCTHTSLTILSSIIHSFDIDKNYQDESILEKIKTYEGFIQNKKQFDSFIFMKMLESNGSNHALINKLTNLRKYYLNDQHLEYALEKNDYDSAIQYCKKATYAIPTILSKSIKLLSNGIASKPELEQYYFNQKYDIFNIKEIEVDDKAEETFECPISYEDAHDLGILLKKQQFCHSSKKNFDPYPQIQKDFANIIDIPISISSYNQAKAYNIPITKSPLTRQNISHILPLGACSNNVEYANMVLKSYFKWVKPYVPDLIFAAIWRFFEETKIERYQEIKPFVRRQMIFRLNHSLNYAYLHPLVGISQEKLSLRGSVFYTLSSPFFFDVFERLNQALPARIHTSLLPLLIKLNELAGNPKTVIREDNILMWQTIFYFYNISMKESGRKSMRELLHQNKNGIPIDMPSTPQFFMKQFPYAAERVKLEEAVAIVKNILNGEKFFFPFEIEPEPYQKYWVNESEIDSFMNSTQINLQTMHPVITPGSASLSHQFPIFRAFSNFVIKKKRYPLTTELEKELHDAMMRKGVDCLMIKYQDYIEKAKNKYSKIVSDVTPEEFIRIYKTAKR